MARSVSNLLSFTHCKKEKKNKKCKKKGYKGYLKSIQIKTFNLNRKVKNLLEEKQFK